MGQVLRLLQEQGCWARSVATPRIFVGCCWTATSVCAGAFGLFPPAKSAFCGFLQNEPNSGELAHARGSDCFCGWRLTAGAHCRGRCGRAPRSSLWKARRAAILQRILRAHPAVEELGPSFGPPGKFVQNEPNLSGDKGLCDEPPALRQPSRRPRKGAMSAPWRRAQRSIGCICDD